MSPPFLSLRAQAVESGRLGQGCLLDRYLGMHPWASAHLSEAHVNAHNEQVGGRDSDSTSCTKIK